MVVARYEQIINMRKRGLTYRDIGLEMGISRERVRQILNMKANTERKNTGMNQALTVRDVAQLLNIHVNTVRRWSNNGVLKTSRIGPRGDRRFNHRYIKNLLKKGIEP